MYRFKSIKYLVTTAFVSTILFVIGYISSLFFLPYIAGFREIIALQLFDAVLIAFCAFFPGPMMLFAGPIAGAIFDLISGYFIMIPITILIRILMFVVIKLLTNDKWWSALYSFFVAVIILLLLYPLYNFIIYQDKAKAITELIVDAVQSTFAYFVALFLYYLLLRIQIKTNYNFWDDHQFDYLKITKQKVTINSENDKSFVD